MEDNPDNDPRRIEGFEKLDPDFFDELMDIWETAQEAREKLDAEFEALEKEEPPPEEREKGNVIERAIGWFMRLVFGD